MSAHTHPCRNREKKGCPNDYPCDGDYARNHDGWPEWICSAYHAPGGVIDAERCEDCHAAYLAEQANDELAGEQS